MKTNIKSFVLKCTMLVHLVIFSLVSNLFGQATVTNSNPDAAAIALGLNANGLTISSPQIVRGGNNNQIAIFTGGTAAGLGVNSGVLFSTGNAVQNITRKNPAVQESVEAQSGSYNDPQLTGITSNAIWDVVVYTFKITLTGGADALRIAYQFGSEEYPDYVGSQYNDTFGFFVRKVGTSAWTNMARLPNPAQTVTAINKVNYGKYGRDGSDANGYDSGNSFYYLRNGHTTTLRNGSQLERNNAPQPGPFPIHVEYNGLTKLIQYDLSGLTPGGEYEFKIAIADAGDRKLDAGVFVAKIEGVFGADLAIEKIVDKPTPCIDDIVEFTLTAKNIGPAAATGVVVNDLLPDGFEYDSHTAPAGTTYVPATGVWTIGGLALYGESVLKIRAKVKSTGNYTNQATITGTKNDPDATNNIATVTLVPTIPTITGTLIVCQDNTTQLTGSGTAAATNAWTSSNTNVATVSSTGLVTGKSAGTTIITYKNSNGCTVTTTVTVHAKTVITVQPQSPAAYCEGGTATLNVTATGQGTLSYQWYKVSGGNATLISGATSASYATPTDLSVGTHTYRVIVSGGGACGTVTSNDITVTVHAKTVITVQPQSPPAYCIGGSATLSVTATGQGTLGYQWYKVTGGNATLISGATSSSYATPADLAAGTHTYRVIVSGNGACGTATSSDVTVTVKPATTITAQPVAPAAYCEGGSATLSVSATGDGTLGYQWYKVTGGTAALIGGATSSSYATPTDLSTGTHTYRVVVTGGCGSVTSTDVTVTVHAKTVITVQPQSPAAYCEGGTATLNVTATGQGTLSYQWYKVSGGNATLISGATSASYATPTDLSVGTHTYRVIVSGGGACGTVTSNDITVTVHAKTVITVQPQSPPAYCIGGSATLSVTATGQGTLGYQWYKVTGGNATLISGATSSSYATPADLAAGTHTYRVIVSGNGACGTATSSDVTVTVKPATTITAQPVAPAAYCEGGSATLSVSATGDGTLGYQWYKVTGGTAALIGGATSSSYATPTDLSTGTHTYRVVVTGGCGSVTSTDVTVTVHAKTVITVQPQSPAAYCEGGTATLNVTATGQGTLSYQWYKVSGGNATLISGATSASYATPTDLSVGTHTYRVIVSGGGACGTVTSNDITVTVHAKTVITVQPQSPPAYCIGGSATLSVTATGQGTLGYQWYKVTGGNATLISGATSSSYATPADLAAGTHTYRVIVSGNGACGTATSSDVTVTVKPATTITAQPVAPAAYCEGGSATLSVSATGDGTLGYQWYKVTGGTAALIGGATSSSYATPTDLSTGTHTYRVVVTGGCGSVTSTDVTVTVHAKTVITVQPQSPAAYCEGGTATLNVTATGQGTLSYQWYKVSGGNATLISGATSASYATPTDLSVGTHTYRVIVSGGGACGTVTSNDITVTVHAKTVITVQPQSPPAYCIGGSATLSVTATGQGTLGYQWYKVTGGNATLISGATSSSYATPADLAAGTHTYRVIVSGNGACGTATSSDVTVTVKPATTITAQPVAPAAYCEGGSATLSVSATGDGTLGYQWYKVTGGTAELIGGATSSSYATPTDLSTGTHTYRVVVTGGCETATSTDVIVTVNGVTPGAIAGTQTVCNGTVPVTISSTTAGSATGSLAYQWEFSVDNGANWTPISGATAATYTPDAMTVTTSYRRVSTSTVNNSVCTAYSNEVLITVTNDCNVVTEKTVRDNNNSGKAESNEELTYSIKVTNNYDRDITVNISDIIPANTAYVSSANAGVYTAGNNTITWNNLTVPANSNATVTFVVKVVANLTGISNIYNVATVSGNELPVPQTPEVEIPTDSKPSHSSVKTVADENGDNKAQSGEELTYTITVKNTGDVALTGIAISDAIPANTSYVPNSATGGGTITGSTLNWSVAVPFGGEVSVSFKVTVNADLTGVTSIKNIATVGGDTPEVEIPTDSKPSHSSVKTVVDENGDNKAQSGEELTYTITVKNTGDVALTGIAISDAIPANTSYVPNSATGGGTITGSTLNWSVAVPFGGEVSVSFKVTVNADLTGVTSIKNIATVGGDTPEVEIPTDSKPSHSSVKTVVDENGDNKAQSGEELTYTITVKNTGDVALTGVAISDAIPANTSYVPNSATGGGTITGSTLNWSVAVPFGGEVSVSFKVTVNADLTGVTSIKNIATVGGDTPEVEIPTDSKPSHSSVKTVVDENGDNKAQSGEELTYTITVKNTGDVALTGIAISDAIPANTSYVPNSATGGGTLTGNTLDWSVAVPFGGEVSVSFKVTVNADLTGVTSIKNIATVGGDTPEVEIPTDSKPSHSSVKTVVDENGDNKAQSGEELTYTITVKNTGDVALTGIAISDAIPANTTYVANSATGGGTITGNTLDWSVAVPFGGEVSVSFKVTVNADLTGVTSIKNIATVGGDTPEVEIPTDSKPSHSSVKTVVDENGDNKAQSGEELTYTITVKNTGDVALTGIAISDAIPANTSYVPNSATGGGTITGSTLNWSVAVPFGGEVSVSFKVTVNADLTGVTSIKNIATVGGDTPEVEIPTDSKPSHSSVKTVVDENGDNKAQSGEELTYTITVKNTGDVALTGIAISDAIPANTTYVANSATGGGTLTGNTLDWSVAVPFGGEVSVSFKVTVNADLTGVTSIKNIATVGGDTPEVEIPTDSKPSHSSVKTVVDENGDNKAQSGEELTYTITVKNTGDVALTGIAISDAIPANTSYVPNSATGGGTITGSTLNWSVAVPFGGEVSVSFKVTVNADLTGVTSIKNIATVGGDTPEVEIPTDSKPSHSSVKTVADENGDNKAQSGEELTYTITVKNTGDVALTGIAISDAIPANTSYVPNSATGGGTITGSTLNWSVAVPFGGEVSVSFKVTVNADLTGVTSIKNIATVGGDTPEVEIPTDSKPSHSSVKTVVDENGDNKAQSGEELTYTITVKNTGDVALTGIAISDAIPANTTYVANSATGGGTLTGNTLDWSVAVPFGGEVSVSFKVTVNADLTGVTSIKNIATVGGDTPEVEIPTDSKPSHSSVKTVVDENGDNKAQSGEELTYTITVKNTGDVALTGIAISDAIPANTSYVPNSATGGGTLTGNTLDWSVAVPFGGEVSVSFKVTVNADLTGVTSIKNIATVGGDTPEVEIPTDSKPSHSSVKTVVDENGDNKAQSGEELTYTITVKNTGDVALTGIAISDAIPANTSYVPNSATGGGTITGSTLNWSVAVPFGGEVSVSFKVTVNADLTGVTSIKNIATVGGDTPEVEIPTDSKPSHSSVKTVVDENGDNKAQSGEELTYTITVKNTGDVALTGIAISDAIPANTTYVANSATGGGTLTGNTLDWSVAVPFGGEVSVSFKVTVNADLTGVTSIKNIATVGGDTPEVEIPTDSKSSHNSVKTVVDENGDNKAQSGELLTYTIRIENDGDVDLKNLLVTDMIPAYTTYEEGTASNGAVFNSGKLTWTVDVPFGQALSLSFKVKVNSDLTEAAEIRNIATVGDKDTPPAIIETDRFARISLDKKHNLGTSNDCFGLKVNDKITYTFTVKNTGNVALNNLDLTSTLSPRLGNITSTAQGALLPGATREFTAEYVINQADINRGFVTGIAKVIANTPVGQISGAVGGKVEVPSNEVSVKICQTGKVAIEKTVDKQEVSKVGEELTYTIKVTNTGNTDLEDVTVEDAMLNLKEVINLTVGEVKTYQLKYTVTYNDLLKASLDNIASAILKTREKVTDEASTKISFEPEISIVKSADKSVITFLGELVEYTIEVTNTGTVDLVSVVVTDPMFPNFTGTVGNLAKGETRKFDLTYESVLADIIRGEIRNTARVQGKVGGAVTLRSFNPATGVIEKLSNEVLVKVVFNNVLEVTKDADKTEVNKEGEVITYTIKVANKGNYDLTDVVVKDPLTGMMETIGNMAVGAEKTFKTTYKVRRADFDKGSIVNEVLVTAKDLAGGQLDGRAERIVGIAKMPFFIPNVFTPNDDGTNDTFEIEGIEGFDRIEVTILNRWGNEVYRNSNYKNEWTGHGLNEGTYFYIVKTIKGTKEDLYKGHVLIKTR